MWPRRVSGRGPTKSINTLKWSRDRRSGMQPYRSVLGRLGLLTRITFAHIREYLCTHSRPPKISGNPAKCFVGPQVAGDHRIVKVVKEHVS
jgi:hypothetical protein